MDTIIRLRDELRTLDDKLTPAIEALEGKLREWQLGVQIEFGNCGVFRKYKGEWRLMEPGSNIPLKDTGRIIRVQFLEYFATKSLETMVEEQLRLHIARRKALFEASKVDEP